MGSMALNPEEVPVTLDPEEVPLCPKIHPQNLRILPNLEMATLSIVHLVQCPGSNIGQPVIVEGKNRAKSSRPSPGVDF